jgi:hypothetical protein
MRRRTCAAVALLAGAFVLTACGGDSEPTAPTGQPDVTAPTVPSDSAGAEVPTVSDPLDAAALTSEPCTALTSAQLDELGLTEGETRPNDQFEGEACRWKSTEDSLDSVDLTALDNTDGLAGVYAAKNENAYFEPTDVAGYPAVYSGLVDARDSGACNLWVGVDDETVLHVLTNLGSADSADASCGFAADVAEATISTLGG